MPGMPISLWHAQKEQQFVHTSTALPLTQVITQCVQWWGKQCEYTKMKVENYERAK
jgi:hypothetical protein